VKATVISPVFIPTPDPRADVMSASLIRSAIVEPSSIPSVVFDCLRQMSIRELLGGLLHLLLRLSQDASVPARRGGLIDRRPGEGLIGSDE
jgi:hypothetical protein